ncbi:hypothetical protein DRQ25_18335 [Candidatus Fermentibacteria bacterium]|nr:MAG: hypothetical protein DRQ25_18335 [Candidatus Fermentibacteria bacterium]
MNSGYKGWIEKNLDIVDKSGQLVPFKLNPIQEKFLTQDTTNGKDIILKARQQGFSSLINGVFLADFLMKPNTYNVVIADDADNAQGLLKRVKDYMKTWCEKKGVDIKDILKYNSKYEMYFAENNSTYHIGTAQNTQFGRSRTITNLHMSEAAFYPHLDELLAGAMQAVVPDGRVIIETTANGFNAFKSFWDRTALGETPFTKHFYKASDFYDEEFLKRKEGELGRLFRQEYPETPLEAFITSGETYFKQEALEKYLEMVKHPIKEGVIYV